MTQKEVFSGFVFFPYNAGHRTPIEIELYAPQMEGEEIDDVLDEQV